MRELRHPFDNKKKDIKHCTRTRESQALQRDHGVGSSDHFQEPVILIMIHCCLNSHVICLDK